MLLNNLHALRIHTQGIFEDMGGEEVSEIWFVCDRSNIRVLTVYAHFL